MSVEHLDVVIVGAGLSGIGAAYHLMQECPDKRFALLEGRERLGGTWDLFRYPGIRSDSDMYTLGYNFKPWRDPQAIADGPSILRYIDETARENGIHERIRFRHRVRQASWDSESATWTLQVDRGEGQEPLTLTCQYLMMCSGYYRYEAGYTPVFEGSDSFEGTLVHPQLWPEELDYRGKRVVVIGSGATAVTLVPAMAEQAAQVTMLQRSPTYVATLPQQDVVSNFLRRFLPDLWVYRLARTRNVALQLLFYKLSKRFPSFVRRLLLGQIRRQLGADYDLRHFSPSYKPWDQRVCAVPDGDLFKSIKAGKAAVVTDRIQRFTPQGILLESGQELPADIIITATGLELQLFGGMQVTVDGQPFESAQSMGYRGLMLRDLPNLAVILGYTNASWTLKADLSSEFFCRLIKHAESRGARSFVPRAEPGSVGEAPFLDLQSGYIERAAAILPKQGDRAPWKLYQNYLLDLAQLRYGALEDGCLQFGRSSESLPEQVPGR